MPFDGCSSATTASSTASGAVRPKSYPSATAISRSSPYGRYKASRTEILYYFTFIRVRNAALSVKRGVSAIRQEVYIFPLLHGLFIYYSLKPVPMNWAMARPVSSTTSTLTTHELRPSFLYVAVAISLLPFAAFK